MFGLRRPYHLPFVLSLIVVLNCRDESGNGMSSAVQLDIQLEERFSVGDPDTFAEVSDLLVDHSGGIYVLDGQNRKVIRFDQSGRYLASVGTHGDGAGQLESPQAITFCPAGKLWILDPANLRLSVFQTSDNKLTFGRDVPNPFPAADVCMVGNKMFLLGLFSGHLLHKLSPAGEVVASFDSVESYGLPTEESLSSGRLLCDEPTDRVVVVPSSEAAVHAFSSPGELVWIAKQTDVHPTKSEVAGSGVEDVLDSDGERSKAITLVTILPGIALVQFEEDMVHSVAIRSRLLSLDSGTVIGSRTDLPRILFVRDGVAYAAVSAPHPQVVVYDVRPF